MGNYNCKRCFSKEKEPDLKLGGESEIDHLEFIDFNSPKMNGIQESVPKEKNKVLGLDLKNANKEELNILENKIDINNINNFDNHNDYSANENNDMKNYDDNNLNHSLDEEEQEQNYEDGEGDGEVEDEAYYEEQIQEQSQSQGQGEEQYYQEDNNNNLDNENYNYENENLEENENDNELDGVECLEAKDEQLYDEGEEQNMEGK